MPRQFFKPISRQRHRWKERWFMRPFRVLLEHPVYWSLNRRNVSRAFALGLFVAFIPLPIHLIAAVCLALLFRLNVPSAMLGTLVSNPITAVPMYLFSYWVGCQMLGTRQRNVAFEMSWDWISSHLLPIWKPFLLGCFVVGSMTAIVGYAILAGLWHLTLVLKYHERKNASAARMSAKEEK
jgi:uncharacterized protein (DUF2062 family)